MTPLHFFGLVFMAALSCASPGTNIMERDPASMNSSDELEGSADEPGELMDRNVDSNQDDSCISGMTTKGDKCLFPFKYHGQTFKTCTNYNGFVYYGKYWCPTKLDDDGSYISGEFGYCSTKKCSNDLERCISNGKLKGAEDVVFDCLRATCGVTEDDGIAPWHVVVKFDIGGPEKSLLGALISPRHVWVDSVKYHVTLKSIHVGSRVGKVSKVYLDQNKIQRSVTHITQPYDRNYIMTLDGEVDLPYACWEAALPAVNKNLKQTYLEGNELREEAVRVTRVGDGRFYVTGRITSGTVWVEKEGRAKLTGFRAEDDVVNGITSSEEQVIKELLERVDG